MTDTAKTIFWDFDFTLVYNSKWSRAVLEALDTRHPGHGIAREQISAFLHQGFPWHDPEKYHPELSTPEAWWGSVCPILAGACRGNGYDEEESAVLADMARRFILRGDYYIPYEDALPVLERLKNAGWRHFILSNNFPELPDIVDTMPLEPYIEGCITSGLAGYEKPHPGIFKYALTLAGNPETAWMVGDNIDADVRGAEALGIPAILVHRPVKEKVKYYADTLEEAADIIETSS